MLCLSAEVQNAVQTAFEHNIVCTLEDMLEINDASLLDYMSILSTARHSNNITLKRDVTDVKKNCYNATCLLAWQGNIDFQYINDPGDAVVYILPYMPKCKRMSELLQNIAYECESSDINP